MFKKLKRNLILFLTLTLLTVSAAPALSAAAEEDEITGYATWSIEALTIGYGYILEPVLVPVHEGENAAKVLDRLLSENGFSYDRTGEIDNGFYMSRLGPGGALPYGSKECFGYGAKLDIPEELDTERILPILAEKVPEPDIGWAYGTKENTLGEFDYNSMSGWMVTLNNEFTLVGFSDFYVSDGDVVRIQFTLNGYGADLGVSNSWGDNKYYDGADKAALLTSIAEINSSPKKNLLLDIKTINEKFNSAIALGSDLIAAQEDVNAAADALMKAVSDAEKPYDVNVDGEVNILDMIVLKKIIAKKYRETLNSDINSDGEHNSTDITLLRQRLLAA